MPECTACLSENTGEAFESERRDHSVPGFTYWACADCGTHFLNPVPSGELLEKYYALRQMPSEKTVVEKYDATRRKRDTARYIEPLAKWHEDGRLLDFGSGEGWIVHLATKAGYEAVGVDRAEQMVLCGRRYFDGEFRVGDQDSLDQFDEPFQVVTAISVLEHMREPEKLLSAIRDVLTDDGILALQVPSSSSLQFQTLYKWFYWAMAPRHIHLFSVPGLKVLMNRAGFNMVALKNVHKIKAWTRSVADMLEIRDDWGHWYKNDTFKRYDLTVNALLDDIAYRQERSSAVIVYAEPE